VGSRIVWLRYRKKAALERVYAGADIVQVVTLAFDIPSFCPVQRNDFSRAGVFSQPMHTRTFPVRRLHFIVSLCAFLIFASTIYAQQRPLLTEDPRLIPSGSLDMEAGFGYENRAVYTLSNLEGDHVSLLTGGLHFGLGDRAEFQMTGTVYDFLQTSDGDWHSDFGDFALSTKMKMFSESRKVPIISFRPTVVLPNANQGSGLGLNTTRFFASMLAGKTFGKVFVFGNAGIGILDKPTTPGAQDDVWTYGLAASVPISSRANWVSEINGLQNPRENPAPGSETRRQVRTGLQIQAGGTRFDIGALAGLTDFDPKYGVVFGMTTRFKK